jgi:GDPmannose 4,6-dehydratase
MKAFITGCDGQDGHYLSKFLLGKGYEVYGLVRRSAQEKKIPVGIKVVEGDVTDQNIIRTIETIDPDEIYNLAGMSHVGESFKIPHTTFEINACGALNVLEGARLRMSKFYQASSSELFGNSPPPQNEKTPFYPRSPYAVSNSQRIGRR